MIYISRELKLFAAGIAGTLIAASGLTAIVLVDYNSQQSGFTSEQHIIKIDKQDNMRYDVDLLGKEYTVSFEPANKAAGFAKKYYTLVPAPLRLAEKLVSAAQGLADGYIENKKQKEYINYVLEEINPYSNAKI
ncbi:MAG TPA: hypothetical protein DCP97_03840 [Ruminococcaceae bacterium]|nr:hypothetical protein [Oscillospiraceae bacterium]